MSITWTESIQDELAELTTSVCEGDLSSRQATRLEAMLTDSPEARRFYARYLLLHGELYWDEAASLGRDAIEARRSDDVRVEPNARRRPRAARWLLLAGTLAATVALAIIGWSVMPVDQPGGVPGAGSLSSPFIANMTGFASARFFEGIGHAEGEGVLAGQQIQMEDGLLEVTYHSGVRVLLQGPATYIAQSSGVGYLQSGRVTVDVPASARGFQLGTPQAVLVDLGTEFGVSVEPGHSVRAEVFAGRVDVFRPGRINDQTSSGRIAEGRCVEIVSGPDGLAINTIASLDRPFVRQLPERIKGPDRIAVMRDMVRRHPRLIHHYTFEGTTRQEKRRDRQGDLNLIEAVMSGGQGAGRVDYSMAGANGFGQAVRPYREPVDGDTRGVGLQTELGFHPPRAMSVELLVRFAGFDPSEKTPIGAALATRKGERPCAFLLAVTKGGRLVQLTDREADWVDSTVDLPIGSWYYVAATFEVEGDSTTINTYVADLSAEEKTLRHVVVDHRAPGVPPSSRLGVGKALGATGAHAYPWPGELDEVAIYDAVLESEEFQQHLEAYSTSTGAFR